MTTRPEDYTVGWICAIPTEVGVARGLLDEEYERDRAPRVDAQQDHNAYIFGRIHEHNIVIACLPHGRYGTIPAAVAAKDMTRSFPAIRFGLMVGIGGGAPSQKHDIRLGDVVVSSPVGIYGGVIQYDHGKAVQNHKFERTGYLAPPPTVLLNALTNIISQHSNNGHRIEETIANMLLKKGKRLRERYSRPDQASDTLYESSWFGDRLVTRKTRSLDDVIVVHYGLIASGDKVIKDRTVRDALIAEHDILCFEMEAAGLMNDFPCLVIRGICDYCDTHKNDSWQDYAAATAAAYAKELLEIIPGKDIISMKSIEEANKQLDSKSFDIPFSLEDVPIAKKFVDRKEEMQRLEDALVPMDATDDTSRRRVFVLRGLGGIGKTQLAVAFMQRYHTKFSAVFWLDGSSEDSLKQSIAKQASRIPSSQITRQSRTYVNTGWGNIDAVVIETISWLKLSNNRRWLMVFDNVDHEFISSKKEPSSYDIKKYMPAVSHGSVLITTRLGPLEKLGESQEVKKVDDEIARAILESWHDFPSNDNNIKALLERLDGLPLAIAQAGAYLHQKGIDIGKYLQLYDEQKERVVEALHKPDELLGDYPNRSVWTTWNISYNAILAVNKHTAKLLVLWSFLDRNDFWYGLFEEATSAHESIMETLLQNLGDIANDEMSFIDAMGLLRDYSLIEGTEETKGYMMHTVVHRWMYFYHGIKHRLDLGLLALNVVGFAVPTPVKRDYARIQQRLLPHANMCLARVADVEESTTQKKQNSDSIMSQISQADSNNYLSAVNMLGVLYADQGKLAEAERMYERALQGQEKTLGAEHSSTLSTVNNLGNVYQKQGRLDEAEEIYERALRGLENAPGAEHTSVESKLALSIVNNLGTLYAEQGKLVKAEKAYERALQGYEKVLEPENSSTLQTVNNLGFLYFRQGKLEEAERMYLRALQGSEKTLDPEHTLRLGIINNLAGLYQKQGKLAEAENMHLQVLQGKEKVLGAEHPLILSTLSNLGVLYADQGRLDKAEEMFLRALQVSEKVLGAEHPSTLMIVNNLGLLNKKQGKLAEAEKMYERALQGYEKVHEAEHPSILMTTNNLGDLYQNQGKLAEAEKILLRALQSFEEVSGAKHPDTIQTVANIGNLYFNQGRLAEAEEMYERALQGYEGALTESPSTMMIINNLGSLYADQGRLNEAEKMCLRALQGSEKVLGAEHPSVLMFINNLGRIYMDQDRLDEAQEMYERALQGYEKALGMEERTSKFDTVSNLGFLYFKQGKLEEAQGMYLQALRGYEDAFGAEGVKIHIPALKTMWNLGCLYSDTKIEESKTMYRKALAGYTKIQGASSDACLSLARQLDALDPAKKLHADSELKASLIKSSDSKKHEPEKREKRFDKLMRKLREW